MLTQILTFPTFSIKLRMNFINELHFVQKVSHEYRYTVGKGVCLMKWNEMARNAKNSCKLLWQHLLISLSQDKNDVCHRKVCLFLFSSWQSLFQHQFATLPFPEKLPSVISSGNYIHVSINVFYIVHKGWQMYHLQRPQQLLRALTTAKQRCSVLD